MYLLLKRPDSLQVFCIATSLLNVFVAFGSFLSTYNPKYTSFFIWKKTALRTAAYRGKKKEQQERQFEFWLLKNAFYIRPMEW